MSRPEDQDFDLMEYLGEGDRVGMYLSPQPPALPTKPEPEPEEEFSIIWAVALILLGILTIICLSYLASLIRL